ncbi:hypothetical protein AAII07_39225 [Microvirga sp. 0TCS3.31]
MTRSSIIVASALTLMAASILLPTITTPATAQEFDRSESDMGNGNLRDLLRDWVGGSPERRDMLMDLLQERREDRREARREDRRERRADRMDDRGDLRDQLREGISSRRDNDEDDNWRDRGDRRERWRERISSRWDDDEDEGLRGRLRERLAERRSGNCYVLTRSLRDEDHTLAVIIRRRVCRD